MTLDRFGSSAEGPVHRLVVGRAPGVELELLTLGATVHRLWLTGGDDVRRNVVLGHPAPRDYLEGPAFLGGTVGRYANRIAGGSCEVDGQRVELATNEGAEGSRTTLHGGPRGFDKRLWRVIEQAPDRVVLGLTSTAGDQGFPGTVEVRAEVSVAGDEVAWELLATTDAPTPLALTQHTYFALDGEGQDTGSHTVRVDADTFLPVDERGIPLPGPPHDVGGTPFDLRRGARIADVVGSRHPQLRGGLDHDFVLAGEGVREVAWLSSPSSRTRLTLSTDQSGLQVFTGQGLAGLPTTSGAVHVEHGGIALEAQAHPDTPHRPDLGDAVLRPGETYRNRIRWRFAPTG
jgi:galactose mutarotase-like enzyme